MKLTSRKLNSLLSSFRLKLLSAFLLCTLIPMCIIGFVSYRISYSIAYDKVMDSAILAADQLHVQITDKLRQAENVADTLQYGMYTLESTVGQDLETRLDSLSLLRNDVSLYKSTFGFRHICVFLRDDQFGSQEGLYFYPLSSTEKWQISTEQLQNLGSSSLWLYRTNLLLPFLLDPEQTPGNYIICCRSQHNQGTGHLDYAYCILIDADEISDLLAATFSNTSIGSYLITPDGSIAAGFGQRMESDRAREEDLNLLSDKTDTRFLKNGSWFYVLSLDNGWFQITEISESYITDGSSLLLRSILFTLLLCLPVAMLVILLLSGSLSRRVRILSDAMESFRLSPNPGDNRLRGIPRGNNPDTYDEIDRLGITFEQMQATIQDNVQSILNLSLAEERLKYQLLQSQINPHFLYNILGSIQTCQSLGKLETASQMISDLTRFYRLTLRKSGELVSLRDELEIASLYLNMQKLCHNNNLEWEIYLEDGIENFMICKFTLQPFLENSILHGISMQTPKIRIQISAIYGDDTVILHIRDNGIGISPKRLSELQLDLEQKNVNYENTLESVM